MTTRPETPQARQAALYDFPYHYLPHVDGASFRQSRHWNFALSYLGAVELITRKLTDIGGRALCDVGCGDGALLHHLRRRLDWELVGVDVDARAIAWARLFNPDIEFIACDVVRTPIDRQFDVVTLIEVIEHLPAADLPAFLTAVCGMLRNGGAAIITVPHANMPVHPKHFQHFTCSGLRNVLAPHASRMELIPFDRVGLLEKLYHKLLLRRELVVDSRHLNLLRWYLYRRTGGFGTTSERRCRRILAVLHVDRQPMNGLTLGS